MDMKEKRESLEGLTRAEIGDVVYVVLTEDGRTVKLSRRLEVTAASRRSLDVDSYQWAKVLQHSPLIIELAGGRNIELGTPAQVLLGAT